MFCYVIVIPFFLNLSLNMFRFLWRRTKPEPPKPEPIVTLSRRAFIGHDDTPILGTGALNKKTNMKKNMKKKTVLTPPKEPKMPPILKKCMYCNMLYSGKSHLVDNDPYRCFVCSSACQTRFQRRLKRFPSVSIKSPF